MNTNKNGFYDQIYSIYKDHYMNKDVVGQDGLLIGSVIDYKHINGKEVLEVEEKETGNITFIGVNDILP